MDTVLVGSAKLAFKAFLQVKKLYLILKIYRLLCVGDPIKHNQIILINLFDFFVPQPIVKRVVELERALVVLGNADLCTLGNLTESVDQPLMLLVLGPPSFHVAETF